MFVSLCSNPLGVTIKGDVIVVVFDVGVGTTGCIGNGAGSHVVSVL